MVSGTSAIAMVAALGNGIANRYSPIQVSSSITAK